MIHLTLEDRKKLSAYLKQECAEAQRIINQMVKINVAKSMIDRRRREVIAMSIVSEMFDKTDVTVI